MLGAILVDVVIVVSSINLEPSWQKAFKTWHPATTHGEQGPITHPGVERAEGSASESGSDSYVARIFRSDVTPRCALGQVTYLVT